VNVFGYDFLESDARFAYCEAMHRKGRASLEGFLQATREELSNLVYGGGFNIEAPACYYPMVLKA
jgi:hypothetical protein